MACHPSVAQGDGLQARLGSETFALQKNMIILYYSAIMYMHGCIPDHNYCNLYFFLL